MTAKKPRFKPRVMLADKHGNTYQLGEDPSDKTRVRVTDARDLTAEQAVEKVLQALYDDKEPYYWPGVEDAVKSAGLTARVVNGKVRVRREKQ